MEHIWGSRDRSRLSCSGLHYLLFYKQYPDGWLWGPFFLLGAGLWSIGALVLISNIVHGTLPPGGVLIPVLKVCVSCAIALSLLVSAIGMLASRAWGWLIGAVTCAVIAVLFLFWREWFWAIMHLLFASTPWSIYRSSRRAVQRVRGSAF